MRIISVIMLVIIGCSRSNFKHDNKYKNDIDYYFNNLNKLNKSIVSYVIEKAEEGYTRALFLYICLLKENPNNEQLKSKIYLLKITNNLIDYLKRTNCLRKLGLLYEDGVEGQIEPNVSKAIEYYIKAIDMGDPDAANNLGLLYENGVKRILAPNLNKAIEYYTKAIDMGDFNAAYNLGLLHEKGIKGILEPNINKAIEYYNKAIDMGSSKAAFNLGLLYEDGVKGELEKNISKAIEYYTEAKQMGFNDSSIELNDLYNKSVEEKLSISISEAVKCVFDLYNKYNYVDNIINEIFILDNKQENNNDNNIMKAYVNNIKECYGIILGQKIANDSNSTVSLFKHTSINHDLFVSYSYISNYLENLLELLKYFDKHTLMIDCIELVDKSKFNNNIEDYVKVLNIEGKDYICLGEDEGYNKLIDIMNKKEDLIIHINKVINKINSNTDLCYALKEIIKIEKQLYDILANTSSTRNREFINKYKDLFENY